MIFKKEDLYGDALFHGDVTTTYVYICMYVLMISVQIVTMLLLYNPFTAVDAIWCRCVITHLSTCYKFYHALNHPMYL